MEFELGKKLPDWKLESIFGDTVPTLEDFSGKALLIMFFNMGCPGCKGRALPFANRIAFENQDIAVLGIHTRFEGKTYTDEELKAAKAEFHIRFPYYRDEEFAQTFTKYVAGGTPHWILIDKNGAVDYSIFGSSPNNALLRLDLKIQELADNNFLTKK